MTRTGTDYDDEWAAARAVDEHKVSRQREREEQAAEDARRERGRG